MLPGDDRWHERLFDGVRVDVIINLGESALEIPPELEAVVFVVLEPLEFLDEVEFEFHGDPGRELEGDVLMGIGPSVAAGAGRKANRSGFLDPLLRREDETVQARLHSNPVEFDGIKSRIIEPLPDTEEFYGASAAQPVANHIVRVVGVFEFGDVGQADDVLLVLRKHSDRGPLDFNGALFGFAHGVGARSRRLRVGLAAQARLISNSIEFEGIKSRVVDAFDLNSAAGFHGLRLFELNRIEQRKRGSEKRISVCFC